jgi:hypothetical protein
VDKTWVYYLAKGLEGLGLVVVLCGVLISINLGYGEQGLESMKAETYALGIGGVLFVVGVFIERGLGSRP